MTLDTKMLFALANAAQLIENAQMDRDVAS